MPRSRSSATSIGHVPLCTSASRSASRLRSISAPDRLELAHAQHLHSALARACDLEAHPSRHYALTWFRHATEPLDNDAGECLVLALRQIPTKTLVHLEDRRPRAHAHDAAGHAPVDLPWRHA